MPLAGATSSMWPRPVCDRISISSDSKTMYLPSLKKDFWNVVACEDGEIITTIQVHSRAHNTICGPSGKRAYMADIGSPWLSRSWDRSDPERRRGLGMRWA